LLREHDPEAREKLPVPKEYSTWSWCERYKTLPLPGLFNQPHILLLCFKIIEDEQGKIDADAKKLAEVNRRLEEAHKRKQGK
jgi:hypothetical protein